MPANKIKTKKTVTKAKKAAPAKKIVKAAPKKTAAKVAAKKPAIKAAPIERVQPPKAEKPSRGKSSFKKEAVKKLLDAKSKILQEVTQKVRSESNTLKFEIGDIYDVASNERERELSLTLGDRDREKLAEIEDALERIRLGAYGECEECGEPVAEDRLRALPFTRVCVECQSRNEKEQRIKGRIEEETGLGILEKPEDEDEF